MKIRKLQLRPCSEVPVKARAAKGFTLLEMLVVCPIIALLLTLLLPGALQLVLRILGPIASLI
jgi:prepilin-type N-terminal cleavage/methylation domain-containing protein